MKKTLLISLLTLGLLAAGCSNRNKAASPDNSSQPAASSDNTSAPSNPNSPSSPAASSSSETASSSANDPDQKFIMDAAKGNRAEVELGKLVAGKAEDKDVKKFAQMMMDDHTKALNELQKLVQSKNITLPDGLPADAQDLENKLSSESGKQLDKDYMDNMVQDHQKDVQEFQDASQNVQDKDVKQWASKTLPTLQKHLKKAQQIDSKMNAGGNPGQ